MWNWRFVVRDWPSAVGLPSKFRYKNFAEYVDSERFSLFRGKNAHSVEFRVYQESRFRCSEPNGRKRKSAEIMKLYKTANKSRPFLSVFCSRKWFGTDFQGFSLPKMVWNRIPSNFFLPKMVQNGIPKLSLLKMVRNGIPRFYHLKIVWSGVLMVFHFREMVRNGILRFFSSAKQAEFRRKSRLFRLVSYSAE